ncbi:hypothetical protein IT414_01200 [bacterium]|nr:hypothetical protein [bacterium]
MDISQGIEPTEDELAIVARQYAMRKLYWPSYTWSIQTTSLNKVEDKRQTLTANGVDVDTFLKRKSDLFNKINASFYHLQKLKENEQSIINLGKEIAEKSKEHTPKGVMGIVGTPYEPIEYEYEALLVTLKSSLDILAMMLSQPSGLGSDNIISLVNDAEQVRRPSELLVKVKALLAKSEHSITIDEFRNKDGISSKRNHAVHKGSLPTGTINIQYTAESADISVLKTRTVDVGGDKTDFLKQQSLEEYAETLFYSVCDLIIGGLELLVGQSLPKGKKLSVYEARVSK